MSSVLAFAFLMFKMKGDKIIWIARAIFLMQIIKFGNQLVYSHSFADALPQSLFVALSTSSSILTYCLLIFSYTFLGIYNPRERKIVLTVCGLTLIALCYFEFISTEPNFIASYVDDSVGYNNPRGRIIGLWRLCVIGLALSVAVRRTLALSDYSGKFGKLAAAPIPFRDLSRFPKHLLARFWVGLMKLFSPIGRDATSQRGCALYMAIFFLAVFTFGLAGVGLIGGDAYNRIAENIQITLPFFLSLLLINSLGKPFSFMTKIVGISLMCTLLVVTMIGGAAAKTIRSNYYESLLQDVALAKEAVADKDFSKLPANVSYLALQPNMGTPLPTDYELLFSRDDAFTVLQFHWENEEHLKRIQEMGLWESELLKWESYIMNVQLGYPAVLFHGVYSEAQDRFFYVQFLQGEKLYEVGFSYLEYRKQLHDAVKVMTYYLLGSIALILILFPYFFGRNIVEPLFQLLRGVREVDSGDLGASVPIFVMDEIGILSTGFNKMTQTLKKNREDLEQAAKGELERQALKKDLESKKSIQLVLDNLDQGYMVFDAKGQVQPGVSKAAHVLFGQDPTALRVFELLGLEGKKKEEFEMLLTSVYDETLGFEQMQEFAPRSFEGKKGEFITIDYRPIRRVAEDGTEKLEKAILIATDKTQERAFEAKALAEANYAKMVVSALKNKQVFAAFIKDSRELLTSLEKSLRTQEAFESSKLGVQGLFRMMHTLKGNSACYYVTSVRDLAHHFETQLSQLSGTPVEKMQSYLPALHDGVKNLQQTLEAFLLDQKGVLGHFGEHAVRERVYSLEEMQRVTRFLEKDLGKNSPSYQEIYGALILEPMDAFVDHFEATVLEVAKRLGKEVSFKVLRSPNLRALRDSYQELISALVHAFRNAVDHGIESPDERIAAGKAPQGLIQVKFSEQKESGLVCLEISDDGKGINPAIIRRLAVERGLFTSEKIAAMKDSEVIQLIFASGFSTKADVTDLSGRGVGLDAVSYEAGRLGGKAWVESEVGQGSRLFVQMPLFREVGRNSASDT